MKRWFAVLLLAVLLAVSWRLGCVLRPVALQHYGIDLAVLVTLFVVAETIFDLSLAIMVASALEIKLRELTWRQVRSFPLKTLRVDWRKPGVVASLLVNRVSWTIPFLYLIVAGWSKLPPLLLLAATAEVLVTIGVGLIVLGLIKAPHTKSGTTIRPATQDDIDGIMEVDREAWGDVFPGDREMFLSRIRVFPEAGVLVAEVYGKIQATLSLQLVLREEIDQFTSLTWNTVTDSGTIAATHRVAGDWLYGVGLAATPVAGDAVSKIMQYVVSYLISNNKGGAVFASRIPGYHRFADKLSPEEYVCKQRGGYPIDPELKLYSRWSIGLVRPVVIVKDYMGPDADPESCGCSVLVEWRNPYHKRCWIVRKIASRFYKL